VDQGRQADRAYRQTADLASLVQRTPSLTTELGRITQRLVRHDRPMPELGGWAMTPSTLIWILDLIGTGRVSRILECGSGSSTVWFALALEQRGGPGRVVSLESSPTYADETRRRLAELGLGERADVRTAELVELELPGRPPQPWFDTSVLPDDAVGMDLLFVDGPVGSIAREARYPALPVLGSRLAPDGLVVLDDSARGDEQRIIEQWQDLDVDGRRYEVFRELDRATAFRPVA
jgi:predicted O-methyltransferase YrrM